VYRSTSLALFDESAKHWASSNSIRIANIFLCTRVEVKKELKKMGFKPLHDRVAVRRLEQNDKTAGGIIIPDTAQEKPSEGIIVSVGSGVAGKDGKIVPLDIKSGDKVLFGKWSGTEIKIDGDELLIMQESDIMGIIN
jgi:chaperonin GroES